MQERGRRIQLQGVVVSNSMEKTVVVRVDTTRRHPRYEKVVKRSKKFYAHDESNALTVGQKVTIVECRPMSKTKCWRVIAS